MRFSDDERERLNSLRNVELPMGAAGLEPATSRV
jgi:hypothetical protein